MQSIKMIISDLGGVVFNFSFDSAFHYWAEKSGKRFEDLKNKYQMDRMYELHEVSQITIDEYKAHICHLLDMELSLAHFIIGWNSIFMAEIDGTRDLLKSLRKTTRIVALSNTNETHGAFMRQKYRSVLTNFERLYFSNEIGFRKPDAESFAYVLADCGVKASEVVFLDDLRENIDGATKMGIKAVQVENIDSVVNGLRECLFES
jgi:HAD superfamily hydrolase (TIGR01509 family)